MRHKNVVWLILVITLISNLFDIDMLNFGVQTCVAAPAEESMKNSSTYVVGSKPQGTCGGWRDAQKDGACDISQRKNKPCRARKCLGCILNVPLIEEKYPLMAAGSMSQARLASLPPEVLLCSEDIVITKQDYDKKIRSSSSVIRTQSKNNAFVILEQMAAERILLKEAKKSGVDLKKNNSEQAIQEYVEILSKDTNVSEDELKTFYDENQTLMNGQSFDAVKDKIDKYLTRKKQQSILQKHLSTMSQNHNIQLNSTWIPEKTNGMFDNVVDKARLSKKPSLINFGTPKSAKCNEMAPSLASLHTKYISKANIAFVDTQKEPLLTYRYGIQNIPTQIFYDRTGKEVFRHDGFMSESDMEKQLGANLN